MITRILQHLDTLVGFDTSDPPATLTRHHPVIAYAVQVLEAFDCDVSVEDLGGGCVNVLATRGEPDVLFNVHLDTVRPDAAWTRDPFKLTVEGERAHGLGACDIKGAAACLLAALEATHEPAAVLFTTDEEAGKGRCVAHFLESRPVDPKLVIVGEPTRAAPVLQHRGFASFEAEFSGSAGHTSSAAAAAGSAIHAAVRWAHEALALTAPGGPLADARFNIGVVEGGTASNVVASRATLRFGFRPAPGPDATHAAAIIVGALKDLLPPGASWSDRFLAPPLTAHPTAMTALERWGVSPGPDVDFWTEAALFAAGGLPALVLGPGDIAQAHAADEFVELDQLERCVETYASIIRAGLPAAAPAKGAAVAP